MKEEKTRVSVDFPVEEHKQLKAASALMGMSIQAYVRGCVEEKLFGEGTFGEETQKAFEDVRRGNNLKKAKDIEELKRQLGL